MIPCLQHLRPWQQRLVAHRTALPFAAVAALVVVTLTAPLGPTMFGAAPAMAQPPTAEDPRSGDGTRNRSGPAADQTPPDPLEASRPAIRAEIRALDTIVRQATANRNEATEALTEALELTDKLNDLRGDVLPAAVETARAADEAATTARRAAADATQQLKVARQRLTDTALGLYMSGPIEQVDLASADPLTRFRTSQSVRTGITELRSRVAAARQDVETIRAEAHRTTAVAQQAGAEVQAALQDGADLEDRIAALRAVAATALSAADSAVAATSSAQASIVALLAGAGAPTDQAVDPSVGILGEPVLTAPQLVSWLVSQSGREGVGELAELYIIEGRELGVRGDVAFIQAVLETGGFQFTGSHNYAGIGHCDSCPRGYAFASSSNGVRAHLQLLRAYADPEVTAEDLAGGPVAPINVSSLGVRGCCASWWGLSGVWASALHYGGTILMMYESALAHAATR